MKNVKYIVVLIMSFLLFILVSCGADIDDNENVSSSISNNASSSITNSSSNISSSESTNVKYYDIQFQNFNGVENEILSTIKVKEGELPGYEGNTPTRQKDDNGSYVFDDWEPSLAPATKNQIYTAKYKFESKLTVTFDANGGEFDNINPHEFSVYKGDKIVSPVSPTKTNYKLGGWTKTKDGIDYWDFSTDVVNTNTTLYAKWETKEAIILSVEGSYIENNVIYMIVDKGIDSVSLSNMVITSNNSYWKLYYDKLGQTEIPTKIAASKDGELNNGDNEFYIVVTSADNLLTNTYKLIVHRSYLIRMDFYDYSVVIHSEYVYSGYEYEINYTPEIKGHTFEYWSYKEQKVEKIVPLGNVDIIAVATVNHYTIEFDSNGGNKVDNIEVEYGRLYNAPIPVREGYTFMGWEYNEELVVNPDGKSVERYLFDSNSKYVAKWQINQYTISLNINNSKAGSVSGAGTYDYGTDVTINATTNAGYIFNGWYKNNESYNSYSTITYHVGADNVVFEAKLFANTNIEYKVEHYQQNMDDDNYPLIPYEIDNLFGTTDTLTNGEVNTYEGFTSPEITQLNINGDGSTIIKLYYTRNSYTVLLSKNKEKAGTITGSGTYKYGTSITITATTNPGYTFNGWYHEEKRIAEEESFDYTIISSNVSFEAGYIANKYTITINNQAENVTISGINSGSKFEFDTRVTINAVSSSGLLIVWTINGNIENVGNKYSFEVPRNDVTITITSKIYIRDGSKVYFGTYPQTKVNDNVLISELDNLAGTPYTNYYNWIDYNYYISSHITSFMFYQDIDFDNNGTYDYRGVYFTKYRPAYYSNSSSTGSTYQDDNGYKTGTVYWFSYDPVEWNILTIDGVKALILANLILDSQDYYPTSSSSSFSHNGGRGYANNYELSAIRKFLNENFYNTAFNDLQKELIETTTVDNSVASTGQYSSNYICNNTSDKMFLLSYSEAAGLDSIMRKTKGTDYAKAQGLFVDDLNENSYWWLRSPYSDDGNDACEAYRVLVDGKIYKGLTYYTNNGVRPACWINL